MSMTKRYGKILIPLCLFSLWCTHAIAADYSGAYSTTQPEQTLTLEQRSDGNVTGTLLRGSEVFNITLGPVDDKMVGAAEDARGVYYPVLAQLYESTLYFKIYQADAQGNAIDSSGIQYDFQRVQRKTVASTGSGWPGSYENPHGGGLVLEGSGSTFSGTLTLDGTSYPVSLQTAGQDLRGSFSDNGRQYPMRVSNGEERDQIVVESEGTLLELSRVGNPLAARTQTDNPLVRRNSGATPATTTAPSGNFQHPDGYFSMNLPPAWSANMMSPDAFGLDTGYAEVITLLLMAELEPDEIGKPTAQIMKSAHEMVDGLLAESFGFSVDSSRAEVQLLQIGIHPGGKSTRPAQGPTGNATIWQGVVVDGKSAFVLVSVIPPMNSGQLTSQLDTALNTVRLNRSWEISEFASRSGRRVSFNGSVLADEELARMEGGTPIIPDGEYWYDRHSGMAGRIGGPTEAYLTAGLNLGGALAADASGGGSSVAFNGRYLHPIDLAGLEMYFGQIRPGRYWIDAQGNYGVENGARLGNLVEEIAAVQQYTAALQAQYQQQLNAAVQQYQGQGGGYYGAGGGYQQGGGSVYSHFANLGASGTGVSVADAGGGDTIVNAGGVLWWPGK